MTRDPLRRRIAEMLEGDVDPSLFESCAADLLRDVYPTLVPVTGGSDAGFDGTIGTEKGPIPLVCTTAIDVIGNVLKNLKQVLALRSGPKQVVVATTQSLSAKRRHNIVTKATALGFSVLQIHDREDFVNRLYDNPRWRKDLLGLSGDPAALSRVPIGARGNTIGSLIGRDAEYKRIRDHQGDLLVVGQPGSGKTFLHQRLAEEGRCLFVVTDNVGQIADAIRHLSPGVLVVDDAHMNLKLVAELLRMRRDLGLSYRLHVNCWPDSEAQCRVAMGVGKSDVLRLGRLSRDRILEIIQSQDIHGPNQILQLLLEQADGKPGLAIALAETLKRGEGQRVWTGEALAEHLLAGREIAADESARAVLAAFSIGGDAGMPTDIVARSLGKTLLEVRQIVTGLGDGGVVEECGQGHLAVYPSALRALLVKQIFFDGPCPLRPEELVAAGPSPDDTAHVLMGARQRGASVGLDRLESLLSARSGRRVWEHLAYVDKDCATYLLSHHPDRVCDAAPGLLTNAPETTIPVLLMHACSGKCPAEGAIENPHRRLREWITGDEHNHRGHLRRRKILLAAIHSWVPEENASVQRSLGRSLAMILSPSYERMDSVPGSEMKISIMSGGYSVDHLRAIVTLWKDVLAVLARSGLRVLGPVFDTLNTWCFPGRVLRGADTEEARQYGAFLREHGTQMLQDMLRLPNAGRAVRSRVRAIAAMGRLNIDVPVDEFFEALFGHDDVHIDDHFAELERRVEKQRSLARRLANRPAGEALALALGMEREAEALDMTNGGRGQYAFYSELTNAVVDPIPWLDAMINLRFNADVVALFLRRVLAEDRANGISRVEQMLGMDEYRKVGTWEGLTINPPDERVTSLVLASESCVEIGAYMLARLPIPISTRRVLLEHSEVRVQESAALAEWIREPEKVIPPELNEVWRRAILHAAHEDEYQLGKILASDSSLAFEWIKSQLAHGIDGCLWRTESVVQTATKSLDRRQRVELLSNFTVHSFDETYFDAILGGEVSIFSEWFENCNDPQLRMLPLHQVPNPTWIALAQAAFDKGATPEQLAEVAKYYGDSAWESASEHFEGVWKEYELLSKHPDVRFHATARRGMAVACVHIEQSREEERAAEMFGIERARSRRARGLDRPDPSSDGAGDHGDE